MKEHKEKSQKSAKYLRMFSDFTLEYSEKLQSRTDALKREAELKKLSKEKKEAMIGSCVQCGTCCRLFFINLTQKEWESGAYETQVKASDVDDRFHVVQGYGGNILRQKKDGSCIYLKNNVCSIHTKRPQACRDFFCSSKAKKFKEMVGMINQRRDNDTMRSC